MCHPVGCAGHIGRFIVVSFQKQSGLETRVESPWHISGTTMPLR